jgi:hypothetical protein
LIGNSPCPDYLKRNPRGAGTNAMSEALAIQLINFIAKPVPMATQFLFFSQNAISGSIPRPNG